MTRDYKLDKEVEKYVRSCMEKLDRGQDEAVGYTGVVLDGDFVKLRS